MALKDDANELKGIFGEIKAAMDEAAQSGMGIADGVSASKEAMSGLIDSAKTLSDYNKVSKDLTFEQVAALNKKIEKEKESLSAAQSALKNQQDLAQRQKSYNESLIKKLKLEEQDLKLTASKVASTQREQIEINRAKDLLIAKQSVIKDAISQNQELKQTILEQGTQIAQNDKILKDFDGTMKDLEKDLESTAKKGSRLDFGKKLQKQLDGVSNPMDQIVSGFSSWLTPLGLINNLIKLIFGSAQEFDKEIGATAKNMNISYKEAANMKIEIAETTKNSKDLYLNSKNIVKEVENINSALGTSVKFSDMSSNLQKDVKLMSKLSSVAGLTAKETQSIMKFSMGAGKSAEKNSKELMAGYKAQGLNNKMVLNTKDALKEVANTSKAIQVSFGGSGAELGKALAAAKGLGVSLNQVDNIAGSLLQFEESIGNELEAELLLGKDINLEKARQAALNGDLATVAEEIANQVGSAAEFSEMNRIQQEAIAKAAGMNREELAAALQEQESLRAIGAESLEKAREKFDTMVAEHDMAYALKHLGDEELAKQFEQQSLDEQRQAAQEQMMDDLATKIIPSMVKMSDSFKEIFQSVKKIFDMFGGWKTILIAIGAILTAKFVASLVQMVVSVTAKLAAAKAYKRELNAQDSKLNSIAAKEAAIAASKVAGAEASTLGAATGPILAGIAAVMAVVGGLIMMNDGIIGPSNKSGFGDRVLLGKEGAISFNNKDTIVAGTDLFANDAIMEPGKPVKTAGTGEVQTGGGDMSSMIEAITALANRPVDIGIDGTKVIEATTGENPKVDGDEMAKNSYKVQ